jgi:hypothetical protein
MAKSIESRILRHPYTMKSNWKMSMDSGPETLHSMTR